MHLVLVRMPLQLELQGRLHGGNLVPCVLRPILQNCAHVLDYHYVRALPLISYKYLYYRTRIGIAKIRKIFKFKIRTIMNQK